MSKGRRAVLTQMHLVNIAPFIHRASIAQDRRLACTFGMRCRPSVALFGTLRSGSYRQPQPETDHRVAVSRGRAVVYPTDKEESRPSDGLTRMYRDVCRLRGTDPDKSEETPNDGLIRMYKEVCERRYTIDRTPEERAIARAKLRRRIRRTREHYRRRHNL
ncbi:hypothetical protein KIPB_011983 [Kipferlia bialata]|uniref:Uncharacterized protein n=1 Tax=Kipferlia bialata TaxID=797122 RepID=A0A391NQZ9_9EUKA|nr:hypothetical protein KIPB_011983 [Kipferlia bialata]|eukprot:g11983.t1